MWFDVESAAKGEDPLVKKAIEWIQTPTYSGELQSKSLTKIYPNPTHNIITIEISGAGTQKIEIELLNVSGQIIFSKSFINSIFYQSNSNLNKNPTSLSI